MSKKVVTPIPLQIDNGQGDLFLWCDASDTSATNIVESGGSVAEWRDRSGNENHIVQATGAVQPDTNTTTQNGLNVIRFNRDDMMEAPFIIPEDDFTILLVAQSETSPSFDFIFSQADGSTDFSFIKQGSGDNFYYVGLNGGSIGAGMGESAPVPVIQALTNERTTSNSFTFYKNGVSYGSLSRTFGGAATSIAVGAKDTGGVGRLDGWIAEIIVYKRLLSVDELTVLNDYINRKWQIY